MQLNWLGEYREFIEKVIKYGNAYTRTFKQSRSYGTTVSFSAVELQTLEYILENEDKHQNMAEIAFRLGVSASTFSKNVKQMIGKGLLEKYHEQNNRKNVIIQPSQKGRKVYEDYCRHEKEVFFDRMFEMLDSVPKEHLDKITDVLDLLADSLIDEPEDEEVPKKLIKIE